jgi:hypothetical protein
MFAIPMSASNTNTFLPIDCKVSAKFSVKLDLPTPPFPLLTVIILAVLGDVALPLFPDCWEETSWRSE